MKTTFNIPDSLLNDLIRETGEKNKTQLVKTALEEMLRSIRRKKLINMKGKLDLDLTQAELMENRNRDMI